MISSRKLPGLARERVLHQLAVHHHEGLGDGPLEARRLVSLVVAEGEEELAQPGVALLIALGAISGPMRIGGREQGIKELLRRSWGEAAWHWNSPSSFSAPFCLTLLD